MTSTEHLNLSSFIKMVHKNLRINTKKLGTEEAWRKHIFDKENLEKYAKAMRSLAVDHWESGYKDETKLLSRVTWTYNICQEYFFSEELAKHYKKEKAIAAKIGLDSLECDMLCVKNVLKLLDVGSCYNPFDIFNCFDVVAIDIAPAVDSVLRCDFLNVNVSKEKTDLKPDKVVNRLQEHSYHVIVFSLLLEYLPTAKQRFNACEKAYKLLIPEGLLIIITPDSNHVGTNAKYMKSWRYVLAELGFSRIRYEKLPHLHCMAFRRSLHIKIPQRWAYLHKSDTLFKELFIPQDFHNESEPEQAGSSSESDTLFNVAAELPFYEDD